MKKIIFSLLCVIVFAGFASSLFSSPGNEEVKKNSAESLSVAPKPYVYTLPDGLTIIVEEDHTAPIATVQAWCATGSIHEGAHLGAGLSHILEHMLFKGTIHRPPGAIAEEVRRQGGSINAHTLVDRTVYDIDIPSTGVADAIDILADAMMNATLPISEYTKEQEVIRREIARAHDNPDRISHELLLQTVFHSSPFCEPVLGYLDIYNKLTRDEVMAYYKERYVPNNLCFIIVGDVNAEQIYHQLTAIFEKYPRQSLPPVLVQAEPIQLGKRIERNTFLTNLSHINIAWRISDYTGQDFPELTLLATILGSGKSSILNQNVHEKKELVYQIGASLNLQGLFWISATADPQKRDAAEAEILQQVELLKKNNITAMELEKAKKKLLFGRFYSLITTSQRASDYGEGWIAARNPYFTRRYFEAMDHVTLQDIHRVATQYLVENSLTITSLDPKPASEPTSKNNSSVPNKAEAANKAVKGTIGTTSNVEKFTLPNGLRLLIHEDHGLPLVSMAALFRGGVIAEDEKNSGITQLLTSTITKGTCSKNAEQIAQTLEQVGGTLSAGTGDDSLAVFVNVMKPDFKLGLDLLADVLTKPIFPKIEVDREKQNQLAALKAEDDQILRVASKLLQKKLFGTYPYARRVLGTKESVAALTPEMLQEFYKQYVVGNNGVVAIFGDIKTEEVLAMATKAFAGLPSGALALQTVPSPTPLTQLVEDRAIQEREQTIVMKGFLGANIMSPDRPALELLSTACNNMGSRFFKGMRDKKSLVYFVNNWNMTGLGPGDFAFDLGVDPKKSTLAREELNREIDHLVQNGLTPEELDEAKKIILKNEAFSHQSNANFGNEVAFEELMGLGFDHYQHRADEINSVTLEEINRVIKKYLGAPGSVEVVVGPK